MAKVLIGLGSVIILYTLVAKLTGIAAITDYFPVEWFSDVSKGDSYYKIEPLNEPSYIWLYTVAVGAVILALGLLLMYLNKSSYE
jgi:hypothetical protein